MFVFLLLFVLFFLLVCAFVKKVLCYASFYGVGNALFLCFVFDVASPSFLCLLYLFCCVCVCLQVALFLFFGCGAGEVVFLVL